MKYSSGSGASTMVFRFCALFLVIALIAIKTNVVSASESANWNALKSENHFALLRHAIAPGTGDPSNFELNNCATQRNLSDEGRVQAVAIGEQFRANGMDKVFVYSSQWCRCLETAKLLSIGTVKELPVLNSFFRRFELEASQTQALTEWLQTRDQSLPTVLVTHQVNITALTGVYPGSGEMIIVRQSDAGEFTVVGRVQM